MIREWSESPVTTNLLEIVKEQYEALESAKGIQTYHPFEPYRTQETLANLNGSADTWDLVSVLLEGDWSYFDEEEHE